MASARFASWTSTTLVMILCGANHHVVRTCTRNASNNGRGPNLGNRFAASTGTAKLICGDTFADHLTSRAHWKCDDETLQMLQELLAKRKEMAANQQGHASQQEYVNLAPQLGISTERGTFPISLHFSGCPANAVRRLQLLPSAMGCPQRSQVIIIIFASVKMY